jgi:CRP-like cAMP-binding protein
MDKLKAFIAYYCEPDEQQMNFILSKFSFHTIRKGRSILKKGQVCDKLVYTEKGNFRTYYKDENNKDITTWIAFDDMLAIEPASFFSQEPTKFNIEAIADSEIASITYKELQQLYIDIPMFNEFGRKIAEEIVIGAINRVISFQNETADQRYQKLLTKNDYLQNVPLKHLASFLGVTDTSLSRLRRKK